MNQKNWLTFSIAALFFWLWPIIPGHQFTPKSEFIVWNVGQGLWTTWVRPHECWHFDMGGENTKLVDRVFQICHLKTNRIFLSHWDWDHVGLIVPAKKKDWRLCIAQAPGGEASRTKQSLLGDLPSCSDEISEVKNLWDVTKSDSPQKLWLKNRSNNHDSHVFLIPSLGILIPGDSTVDEERLWRNKLFGKISGLILGHHGSRTSTGEPLLQKLSGLHWSIASQRFQRFHHPHPEVIKRLQHKHIPLLRTEDWGNIRFEL